MLTILSLFLGVLSVALAWFYGTRKKRKFTKIREHEKKLSTLEDYNKSTGYKYILHDCFHSFSYVGGVLLLLIGIKETLVFFIPVITVSQYFNVYAGGIYIGCSFVLLDLFLNLSKAYKPQESLPKLKTKIEKLKQEVNEI